MRLPCEMFGGSAFSSNASADSFLPPDLMCSCAPSLYDHSFFHQSTCLPSTYYDVLFGTLFILSVLLTLNLARLAIKTRRQMRFVSCTLLGMNVSVIAIVSAMFAERGFYEAASIFAIGFCITAHSTAFTTFFVVFEPVFRANQKSPRAVKLFVKVYTLVCAMIYGAQGIGMAVTCRWGGEQGEKTYNSFVLSMVVFAFVDVCTSIAIIQYYARRIIVMIDAAISNRRSLIVASDNQRDVAEKMRITKTRFTFVIRATSAFFLVQFPAYPSIVALFAIYDARVPGSFVFVAAILFSSPLATYFLELFIDNLVRATTTTTTVIAESFLRLTHSLTHAVCVHRPTEPCRRDQSRAVPWRTPRGRTTAARVERGRGI